MNPEDRYDVLRDVLRELETQVLDYEQAPFALQDSAETLLRIASIIHGLKGKLNHAGRPASAMLLQGLETLVTCYRKRSERLSREATDTLLGAFDVINEGFLEPRENRYRIDAVGDRVIALIDDQQLTTLSGKLRPFPFILNSAEQKRLQIAEEHGERPFVVEKILTHRLELSEYNNLAVYESLRSIGRIIAIRPTFDELLRSRPDALLRIVATTAKPDDWVRRTLTEPYDYCEWSRSTPTTSDVMPSARILEGPAEAPLVDVRPRRILIVEDEFISRSLLLALLSTYGACDVAVDGNEAVAAMTHAIHEQHAYSLICLDIMMPDMDGHQALTGLRKAEKEAGIPAERRAKVVMTTALSDYDNFHRAYQSSCDSYIVKPISKSVLTRQLRRIGILPVPPKPIEQTERERSRAYWRVE